MLMTSILVAGCSAETNNDSKRFSVGVMLSDGGLGDGSFNDTTYSGLIKARDEMDIRFNYKELAFAKTYDNGIQELIDEKHDLIIGVGFSLQEDLEKMAKKYPTKSFVLIDGHSELKNVMSVSFKEEEGSYLLGILAGMKTTSNVVGFIGGMDAPLLHKFAAGFTAGVKEVNPEARVLYKYANDFGNDQLGAEIAKNMIDEGADFIYPAAGFTGIGAIREAEKHNVYSFGVDSDQFHLAQKSVVSSMLKMVDVGVINAIKDVKEDGDIDNKEVNLGISDKGVDIAPVRVLELTSDEQGVLETYKDKIANGEISVPFVLNEEGAN